LQLTHSGRWSRPNVFDRAEPLAAVANAVLDRRVPSGVPVLSDDDLDRLVEDFVAAARLGRDAGYRFIDAKGCPGYLGAGRGTPVIGSSMSRPVTVISDTSCSAPGRVRESTAAPPSKTGCDSCGTS